MRAYRLLLALSHHTQKAAIAHHRQHTGHLAHIVQIHADEFGVVARRTRHPRMHKIRRLHVLHIDRRAGNLARNIYPRRSRSDNFVQRMRLGLGLAAGFAFEQAIVGNFPVGDAATVACADYAITDRKLLDGHTKLGAGTRQQQFARFRGSVTKRHPGFFDRAATGSHALVGTEGGHRSNQLHPLQIDVEFFGDDLPQCSQYALTNFDLARTHGDGTVRIDVQPLAEVAIGVQAAGQRATCCSFGHDYLLPPCISVAARLTARSMR